MTPILFLDSNVVSHWIVNKILPTFAVDVGLPSEYLSFYKKRHKASVDLIEKLVSDRHTKSPKALVAEFSLLEIRSAIREEIITAILLSEGVPVSKWGRAIRNEKYVKALSKRRWINLLEQLSFALDKVFAAPASNINLVEDITPSREERYFDVFDNLLANIPSISTQDAYLLTTAIFYEVDHFVTNDRSLIRDGRKFLKDTYRVVLIKPEQVLRESFFTP